MCSSRRSNPQQSNGSAVDFIYTPTSRDKSRSSAVNGRLRQARPCGPVGTSGSCAARHRPQTPETHALQMTAGEHRRPPTRAEAYQKPSTAIISGSSIKDVPKRIRNGDLCLRGEGRQATEPGRSRTAQRATAVQSAWHTRVSARSLATSSPFFAVISLRAILSLAAYRNSLERLAPEIIMPCPH